MNLVKGKNIIVSMNLSGTYYPIFCAKTFQKSQDTDLVETTSVNSSYDRQYEPGMRTTTLNTTGIHVLDNTGLKISANYLMSNINRVVQAVRITQTDDDGNVYIENFSAIIKRVEINRDTSGYGQSAVDLQITGAVSSTTVVPPNPDGIGVIYKSTTPGANTVSDAILSGKTILEVEREGVEFDLVVGTPVNRQCSFSGTTVTFDAALPFNPNETVMIIYQS